MVNWPHKPSILENHSNPKKKKNRRNYKKRVNRNIQAVDKAASKALQNGSIFILVDMDIPKGAIAALGKGLGFIPTPK